MAEARSAARRLAALAGAGLIMLLAISFAAGMRSRPRPSQILRDSETEALFARHRPGR